MSLDPLLIEVLACPIDKSPLLWFADEDILYNDRLRKSYVVRDGVPVLLVEEATDVGDAEHARLMKKAGSGGAVATGTRGASEAPTPERADMAPDGPVAAGDDAEE